MYWLVALACVLLFSSVRAQFAFNNLTMPAESPHRWVGMQLGITNIEIKYSSPALKGRDVYNDPNLVPKGEKPFPWRAGADENTTFSVSTDVTINGKNLPAGKYGLHMIVGDNTWTIAFSKNTKQWGSFFYNPADDVLRVDVTPTEAPKQEYLTYDFTEHTATTTVVSLMWGTKKASFTVGIDLMNTVIVNLRRELTGGDAFFWGGWTAAADYCLANNINLEEALVWADKALNPPFAGPDLNYKNLGTKAAVLAKLGRTKEAEEVEKQQNEHANPQQLLQGVAQTYATNKAKSKATLDYMNAKHPNAYETANAWAFWYRMEGNTAEALKYYKKTRDLAPADVKANFDNRIKGLEEQLKAKK